MAKQVAPAASGVRDEFRQGYPDGNCTLDPNELNRLLQVLDDGAWTDTQLRLLTKYVFEDSEGPIQFDRFVDWAFQEPVPIAAAPQAPAPALAAKPAQEKVEQFVPVHQQPSSPPYMHVGGARQTLATQSPNEPQARPFSPYYTKNIRAKPEPGDLARQLFPAPQSPEKPVLQTPTSHAGIESAPTTASSQVRPFSPYYTKNICAKPDPGELARQLFPPLAPSAKSQQDSVQPEADVTEAERLAKISQGLRTSAAAVGSPAVAAGLTKAAADMTA